MTLNLPLLYVLWSEEYCQTSPNKNKSPNLWHVTSILVCYIFVWNSSKFPNFQMRLLIIDHSVYSYRRVEELRNLKIMMMYVISLWRSLFVTKVLLEQKNGRSFLPVRHILESIVEFSLIYHIVITYYENYFFLSLIILLLHSAKVILS